MCSEYDTNETYISGNNNKDTTTGNIYGIFDLSGSAMEYTMGNITTDNSLNLDNSFFKDIPIGTDDYDLYQKDSFILGDATKETINWYSTVGTLNSEKSWIVRNNIFGYTSEDDIQNDNITTRIVIK